MSSVLSCYPWRLKFGDQICSRVKIIKIWVSGRSWKYSSSSTSVPSCSNTAYTESFSERPRNVFPKHSLLMEEVYTLFNITYFKKLIQTVGSDKFLVRSKFVCYRDGFATILWRVNHLHLMVLIFRGVTAAFGGKISFCLSLIYLLELEDVTSHVLSVAALLKVRLRLLEDSSDRYPGLGIRSLPPPTSHHHQLLHHVLCKRM